jgi:hypothetical protein
MADKDVGTSGPAPAQETEPKKKMKKAPIVWGIVIVVIVVLGIGFNAWHNTPGFCNAICHTPMDYTVETLSSNDPTLGVTVHAQSGEECLDCHVPTLNEQVSEATKWMSGDYYYDDATQMLYEEKDGQLIDYSDVIPNEQFCLRSGCHDVTTLDELKNKTSDMALNPHDFSQHGYVNCGDCHKMHRQSVLICTQCHGEAVAEVPDGWAASTDNEGGLE